jgi:sugar phosphate isomerase/epimerase
MGSHPKPWKGKRIITKIISKVANDFESSGVCFLFENFYAHNYKDLSELGGSIQDMIYFFENIDSPAIRFCLDIGHANMTGEIFEFINQCGKWLGYVHIHDNMGVHDDHLGYKQGTVPWNRVLKVLLKFGFSGPYVIEFGRPTISEVFDLRSKEQYKIFKNELRELAERYLS